MIEVLLATYNGERWLPELLESLRGQSEQRFTILARDDGSTDDTLTILHDFERANPGKLRLIEDTDSNLGVMGNYSRLLEASTAPYIMFCDQDDVWMPDKIRLTWDAMRSLEEKYGSDAPILVHTDLEVVDESLNTIDPSFWHFQNLNPKASGKLNRILVQNAVTGCASMTNRTLVDLACPIPEEAVMYDWWIALVAAAFGVVEEVPEATIQYRQHGLNTLGAQEWNLRNVLLKTTWAWDENALRKDLSWTNRQGKAFLDRYCERMNRAQRRTVYAWANILENSWLRERVLVIRYGFYKVGLIRNIGMLLRM